MRKLLVVLYLVDDIEETLVVVLLGKLTCPEQRLPESIPVRGSRQRILPLRTPDVVYSQRRLLVQRVNQIVVAVCVRVYHLNCRRGTNQQVLMVNIFITKSE